MAIRFEIRGDTIQLDQLLKATGLADSGGAAKIEIAEGLVQVDGQVELRKRCQLKPGQVVTYGEETITLVAGTAGAAAAKSDRVPRPKKSAPSALTTGARAPSGRAAPRPGTSVARPGAAKPGASKPGAPASRPSAGGGKPARPSSDAASKSRRPPPRSQAPSKADDGPSRPSKKRLTSVNSLWPTPSGPPSTRAADTVTRGSSLPRPSGGGGRPSSGGRPGGGRPGGGRPGGRPGGGRPGGRPGGGPSGGRRGPAR